MKTLSGMLALLVLAPPAAAQTAPPAPLQWPVPSQEQRPWTRWWWLGSAVDATNLTRQLTLFRDAGLGGVEICPIYGVKGWEDRHLEFLSPRWMAMLEHTTREGARLGLGVDLTTGTGWPFGGPWVTEADASARVELKDYEVTEGQSLPSPLPRGRVRAVLAVSESGEQVDLTARVGEPGLDWTAPRGSWRVYALSLRGPAQRVKRAAPGGEGHVLDPYSVPALNRYLSRFDRAFEDYSGPPPRAQFHDSFEYYGAQWTPDLLSEFHRRRRYDLREQLPALFDRGPEEIRARVKADYRTTLFELHLDYVRHWTAWAAGHGSLSRNQAHGAPGNLLDLYAAGGIPETEIFGATAESYLPMQKLASSAAHVTGRNLVSAESFTWLEEHFHASLSQVKQACDYLFLAGANHLFFHGIPYSPSEAPWPGWQFYAAVNFGPQGGLWHDLPAFTAYVTRCQSILQEGRPADDVLVYFPFSDVFHNPDGLLQTLTVHNVDQWLEPLSVHGVAMTLGQRGYGYDFVSDRLLAGATFAEGRLVVSGDTRYRTVLVPATRFMPEPTLARLLELARSGATVLFQEPLPQDVPGFEQWRERQTRLRVRLSELRFESDGSNTRRAAVGKGAFLVGKDVEVLLAAAGVVREACVDQGLRFVRRRHAAGFSYFLANRGEQDFQGWVPLAVTAESVVCFDPRWADRTGVAAVRRPRPEGLEIYLQLAPGESCVLRTYDTLRLREPAWRYRQAGGAAVDLAGPWSVEFLEGGPVLPGSFVTGVLGSWTERGDADALRFAGTARYAMEFELAGERAEDWLLDLGRVESSARVRLNGQSVGTLWCSPFRVEVGRYLRSGRNRLEVEVTNLAANRVRDLDRRGVDWKYFYDANVVGKDYRPLDASSWTPLASGLLGPVRLAPLEPASF